MSACMFCGRGMVQGANLFRLNPTGQKGIWACEKHINQTDVKVDPVVQEIVDALSGKPKP